MGIFEIVMLCCFGAAWVASIYRSNKARTAKGRSVMFLVAFAAGFAAGLLHKIYVTNDPTGYLYALNLALVLADLVIWFRNKRLDRKREEENRNSRDHFYV